MVAPARRSIGSACFDRLGAFISPRQAYNKSVDNKAIAGSTGDRAHSSSPVGLDEAREESVEGGPSYDDLFDAHARRLHRLCRLLLSDPQEAEEVVQEVFLKLHKAQGEGTAALSWAAWLTRVAVNLCHDRRRAGWWPRWRYRTDRSEDVGLMAREPNPEEAAIGEETLRRIWTAFRRLSDRQREVFVLRHLEGWTTEEVATALGLRAGSVKSHLFRAVRELRTAAGGSYR